ncbi:MAG: hypothetical protein JWN05_835 [Arthrobacter sp.]|nr:hypothetical protein [Arthrobacter sp.]
MLVISGDHLDITAAGLGLDGTAPMGTVATGYAPCPDLSPGHGAEAETVGIYELRVGSGLGPGSGTGPGAGYVGSGDPGPGAGVDGSGEPGVGPGSGGNGSGSRCGGIVMGCP